MIPLTLQEFAHAAGVSASHLGRIERGERFPSARVLRRLAKPLEFDEGELFTLANYLSPQPSSTVGSETHIGRLDPYVASVLSQESVDVQRTIIGILSILKSIASSMAVFEVRTPTRLHERNKGERRHKEEKSE